VHAVVAMLALQQAPSWPLLLLLLAPAEALLA
jgi:hypothetical protein